MTGAMREGGPLRTLSHREREIAELIARGLTDREIANRLTLSVRTVEGHIYRARHKLDASTRYELARAAWGDRSHHELRIITRPCSDCPYLEAQYSYNGPAQNRV
jgi:DNA-binding CsgD family transcriptional regulator